MDPVSAIGLASSVITFVEFSWNLIGGAVEIYRSVDGTVNENARLGDVQDDLDALSDLLSVQPKCNTRAERRIVRVAEDCRADSNTLQGLVKEVAGPRNNRAAWRSLKASWLSIRTRKDVAELRDRMREYREEQSSINLGIAKLRDDCSQLKIGFRTQITSTQNRIIEAIDALTKSTAENQVTDDTSLADLSKMLRAIQDVVVDTHLQHRVLRQLVFEDMNSRANQIPKAAQDTYSWTVEDGPVNKRDQRKHAWKLFLQWLRAGDNILHISGNPGSGKSTLMKFLAQHERTKKELHFWAGSDTLIFCSFYFWSPGSTMQRTMTGLYRSFLFQALSQCPQLTEEVFPVQFRSMRVSVGDTMVEKIQMFGEDQIEEAFKILLTRVSNGGYRLCLFIDGLDESEGERLAHEELSGTLQAWATSGKIKLCVSSRPYSEFLRPLNIPGNHLIQLHELNESDIRAYCFDRLLNDNYARERGDICRNLVDTVVNHAQGVFLWVHLVTDVLLVGFRQGDPDSVLKAQLETLPSDLDMLCTKLREPIEMNSIQRVRSNRMLLLAAKNPCIEDLTAVAFSWLEEEGNAQKGLMNPAFPSASKIKPYSDEEMSRRVDHVKRQINGLARGFLEVCLEKRNGLYSHNSPFFAFRVRFCHRTARDFLLQNEDHLRALLETFPNFENSQPYERICLAETIHCWRSKIESWHNAFRKFDRGFRRKLDPDMVSRFEIPLRDLMEPLHTSAISGVPRSPDFRYHQAPHVSFLGYATYHGLHRYVLREVCRDATRLTGVSASGNIFLAAMLGLKYELASALLATGHVMNDLCEVYEQGKVQSLTPACVIAFGCLINSQLDVSPRPFGDTVTANLMKKLLEILLRLKISIWATIRTIKNPNTDAICNRNNRTRVRMKGTDFAEIIDLNNRGIKKRSAESPNSRAFNAVQETSGEAGWVEVQGPDVVQWFDDCIHQHDIEPGYKAYVRCILFHLEKIEWSSDTQELVELRGYTRLF